MGPYVIDNGDWPPYAACIGRTTAWSPPGHELMTALRVLRIRRSRCHTAEALRQTRCSFVLVFSFCLKIHMMVETDPTSTPDFLRGKRKPKDRRVVI